MGHGAGTLGNVAARAPPRRAPSGAAAAARPASPPRRGRTRAGHECSPCVHVNASRLRCVVPRHSGDDVPADHHRVVLMHQVVTVHRILPGKIAEAQEHLHALRRAEHVDVFAPTLVRRHRDSDPFTGPAEDEAFLEMDMDGMGPPVIGIDQLPDLGAALCGIAAREENTSKNCPFTAHMPFVRSNTQRRTGAAAISVASRAAAACA